MPIFCSAPGTHLPSDSVGIRSLRLENINNILRLSSHCIQQYLTVSLQSTALQPQNALVHVHLQVALLQDAHHDVVRQAGMGLLGFGKGGTQRLRGRLIATLKLESYGGDADEDNDDNMTKNRYITRTTTTCVVRVVNHSGDVCSAYLRQNGAQQHGQHER